ncbi:forkhead box, sub-group O isoform X7 [Rhynchophorus ferrugineus]|uniref:forkhead box, sub-group O isoform X7 n=1 Tax=Rhynchophorus ferrugineus TaxID=354439 RepID=UPI003FCE0FDC
MNGPYSDYSPLAKMNLNIMEPLAEVGDGFEPQTRARSNTWPLPRPDFADPAEEGGQGAGAASATANSAAGNKCPVPVPVSALPTKKNSSRRNAWGNLSYADLITQAITTSPDKRLTLSQIYEWMVQNVPYFKDKGDSNSSAGWKNSIRHNLSLHNRFMRVQNEGTGKSSWWMINPDAKPGKSVRRRAASMETSKFEKRRGRVKKKVEMMRNGALPDQPASPSSSVSENLDMFPESPIHSSGGFQLSPESRPRAYSNPSVFRYINEQTAQTQPPPPYNSSIFNDQFQNREFHSMAATSPYACSLHRMQQCNCLPNCVKVERMSPTGMSPSYPHSEPSPDPLSSHQYMGSRLPARPPSSSPPVTPQSQGTPSTMMGQYIGALNVGDDLNINVESLQGGFDCNVEDIIQHELNAEGCLDFNFSGQQQSMAQQAAESALSLQTAPPPAYSQAVVTTPSWVS